MVKILNKFFIFKWLIIDYLWVFVVELEVIYRVYYFLFFGVRFYLG